ncbi:sensor histidine kinase [Microbacterium sp. cx-55]|uniref:sensor histidine kinase n=1 Tax=Microbacterium sp. cx-55 TaxID=2875948 RepID=UPI001CBF29F5|nr:sensor histidine kinase [Microbacterium sp. cx-55]UGB34365.1 sensor histidine kinase [Microbacterium sp. cx-55]
MRFATRMLIVQVATQVAVVAVCAAVFLAIGVQQLREEAESSALNIARTVAEDAQVRQLVAAASAADAPPPASELRAGPLQAYALAVTDRADGLFVVISDVRGIRLAHPNPDRIGEQVSTSFAETLAGREVVTWETGTLGESARAKVPILPPGGGAPVGQVSVGFEPASVFDDLPALLGGIALAVGAAVAAGLVVGLFMRRRLESVTLGVQPEELVALVQTQAAVLASSGDGIVALDTAGVVRVCNPAAARMLGLAEAASGSSLSALPLDDDVRRALGGEGAPGGMVIGDRVIYIDVLPVLRAERTLGTAAVLRDRTDLIALSERLESVRTMSDALRVQRHEFANRLHAATGLIDAGRAHEARDFLRDLAGDGGTGAPEHGWTSGERISDPLLRSFLGAKAIAAAERGATLTIGEDTLLWGQVAEAEDVAAVLGNLIDNAVTAAVGGDRTPTVEVTLLDDGDTLVVTVADSGPGVADPSVVFAPRNPDAATADAHPEPPIDRVHGLGIGLPLSRDLARRRGGDVWLVDAGGPASGAVFGARLPGVMTGRAATASQEEKQ